MIGEDSSVEEDASPELPNVFERNPRLTLIALVVAGCLLLLVVAEIAARFILGLGDPVLYQSSPLYGYRPQPNQLVYRRGGAEIRINNLGLRADRDWDSTRDNKVLFLGNSVTYGGSYIGTRELFSHLALEGAEGYFAGNAGVNGWGIENIHALIVGNEFKPASIYVSVLQEMDFYRGLSKLAGKAFWTHKPRFALEELLAQFHLQRFESIYKDHDIHVTERELEATVLRSVQRLRELEDTLRAHGFRHLLYLSTNTDQMFEGKPDDSRVMRLLGAYGIVPVLIKEREELRRLSGREQREVFYDWNHLSVKGHRVWGEIIRNDLRAMIPYTYEGTSTGVVP